MSGYCFRWTLGIELYRLNDVHDNIYHMVNIDDVSIQYIRILILWVVSFPWFKKNDYDYRWLKKIPIWKMTVDEIYLWIVIVNGVWVSLYPIEDDGRQKYVFGIKWLKWRWLNKPPIYDKRITLGRW